MRVHVKFFAIFRERVGVKAEWTEIADGTSVETLWKQYAARSPAKGAGSSITRLDGIRAAYAVNQRLAEPDQVLHDGDEVGFLPPVSGGAKNLERENARGNLERENARKVRKPRKKKLGADSRDSRGKKVALITRKPLDLNVLVARVAFPGAGAILTFSGVVRDNAHGKAVKHLEYEAYPEMAEQTLRDMIAEIHERWHDARVAMAHRIGRLKVGEASLIIAVAAPHRAEAYAASRYAIERVKQILPVWKKEFASDGDHWVEGPVAGELPPEKVGEIARGGAEYSPF